MRSLLRLIFVMAVFLAFVPISRLPLLPVAPVNAVLYLFMLYCFLNLPHVVKTLPRAVFFLLLVYLGYHFFDLTIAYYKNMPDISPYARLRRILLVVMIVLFTSNEKDFKFALKTVVLMISFSTFFGLLIHFFGEPFQSIRWWIVEGEPGLTFNKRFLMEGERIAGLAPSLFAFSYQIAPAPIMAMGLFLSERKVTWLMAFFLLLLGIILNAERSAALMAALCLISMFVLGKQTNRVPKIILTAALLLVAVSALSLYKPARDVSSFREKTLFSRLGSETEGEFAGRLLQQLGGLITAVKHPLLGGTEADYQLEMNSLVSRFAGKTQGATTASRPHVWYPAPHNHYVNIVMNNGLPGLLLFTIFLLLLIHLAKTFINRVVDTSMHYYCTSTIWAFIAVLGNAFFHNTGIFDVEITSWILVGLVSAGSVLKLQTSQNEQEKELDTAGLQQNWSVRLPSTSH